MIKDGANKVVKLVSKSNNNAPVYFVLPGLFFSTGDITMLVFRSNATSTNSCYLLQDNKKEDARNNNQSAYGNEQRGADHLNGLCIQLSFIMNINGIFSSTFITVTGINERELPKENCLSDVIYLAIKGLCIGATQDLMYNAIGYIVF